MCIACVFPKGTTLTESEFESSWENNHDGGGYTYIDENGVMVTKKFLKYDDFINSWKVDDQAVREYSPRLLHFRATSRGAISVENCHPFSINPTVALIHNGTIAGIPVDKEKSDTRLFSEMLAGLPDNFYTNQSVITLIDGFIGMNKIALMTNYGEFVIFNKPNWVEDNNRIFSNHDFKFRRQQAQGMFPHQVAKWEHNVKEKDAGSLNASSALASTPTRIGIHDTFVASHAEKYLRTTQDRQRLTRTSLKESMKRFTSTTTSRGWLLSRRSQSLMTAR